MPQKTNISISEFTTLFKKYNERFILIALSYVQDRTTAEDVVSESFMTLWNSREELDVEKDKIPAYVLGIVKHKCLDAVRSEASAGARHRNIYEQALIDARIRLLEHDDLTAKIFSNEIESIFQKELSSMPDITSAVFRMSRLEGKTYKEISEALGIPVRSVTNEIQKALSALRKSLKDYLPAFLALISISSLTKL
jgi:RNA polymerase sigma-70 factor (ECF subfamily)